MEAHQRESEGYTEGADGIVDIAIHNFDGSIDIFIAEERNGRWAWWGEDGYGIAPEMCLLPKPSADGMVHLYMEKPKEKVEEISCEER